MSNDTEWTEEQKRALSNAYRYLIRLAAKRKAAAGGAVGAQAPVTADKPSLVRGDAHYQ